MQKVITALVTLIIIAAISLALLVVFKGNKKEEKKKENIPEENEKIVIKFDVNGEIDLDDIEIENGEEVSLPQLAKEGYIFEGWFIGDEKVDNNTSFKESVTLTAKFKKIDETTKTFKIAFDSKGGNTIPDMVVECGKEISLPGNPTRNGYNFVAWIDKNGTPILNGALLTCDDITLYADWKEETKKVKTYNVIFDTKGGSFISNISVECDKELVLPDNPTKNGYDFISWVDKNGTPILNGALLTCNDITLYANWQKKEKNYSCPANYELDGTNCVRTKDVIHECPAGTTDSSDGCVNTSEVIDVSYNCTATTIVVDKNDNQIYSQGEYVGNNECGYYVWEEYQTEESCNNAANNNKYAVWRNGKCYARILNDRAHKYCADGYSYDTQNDKCLKKYNYTERCADGYTLTAGTCVMKIDATVN